MLARGYSARFLGANVPQSLTVCRKDEIEKDLRHMQAYYQAVQHYEQQCYLHHNPDAVNATPDPYHNGTAPALLRGAPGTTRLPIRIDPEEEKRRDVLRQTMLVAEHERAQLEQQYVSLMAHYVDVAQALQQATQNQRESVDFLQAAVDQKARAVAWMRAKTQLARDVRDVLQHRGRVLAAAHGDQTAPVPSVPSLALAEDDPLYQIWNEWENNAPTIASNNANSNKAGKKAPVKPTKNVTVWPSTVLAATPPGVPLLLSATSKAPEKSLAMGMNGDLCWFPTHVPDDVSSHDRITPTATSAATTTTTTTASSTTVVVTEEEDESEVVDQLRDTVTALSHELEQEQAQNAAIASKLWESRLAQDEWVAMMNILRQETEGILHRHNVLLESDMALERAAAKELAEEGTDEDDGSGADRQSSVPPEVTTTTAPTRKADEANDGDDEDSLDEEEEEPQSSIAVVAEAAGKRSTIEPDGAGPRVSSKRRRL
jgi:hypothetical protein